jgi:chemotaxis protein CheD
VTRAELMARMGELVVTRDPAAVLVSIGLGSCIGLAVVDRAFARAGLAHIMLPDSVQGGAAGAPAKFADRAVPALLAELARLGAPKRELSAVLVGGAQMFALDGGSGLDIGGRNERAVRDALGDAGIDIRAAATGGSKGRTVRVDLGARRVTVKDAGGVELPLLEHE